MNFLSRLLVGWADLFTKPSNYNSSAEGALNYDWINSIFQGISIALWIIMGLVGAAGAIYAIYLGVQLARADEQGKRDDAKKHLITVVIAVAVAVVLVLFFNLLLPVIVQAFMGHNNVYEYDLEADHWSSNPPAGASSITSMITAARMMLHL